MAVKLKYNSEKDTWSLKGLTDEQLILLDVLLRHVRLGEDFLDKTIELIGALDPFSGYYLDELKVNFYTENEDGSLVFYGDDLGIQIEYNEF